MIRGPGEPSKPIAGIPITSQNAVLPGSAPAEGSISMALMSCKQQPFSALSLEES